jgi:hypothetical protein
MEGEEGGGPSRVVKWVGARFLTEQNQRLYRSPSPPREYADSLLPSCTCLSLEE